VTVAVAPGELAFVFVKVAVPGPATLVHVPVPADGVLPASAVVRPQTFWSGPAAAVVGRGAFVTAADAELVQPFAEFVTVTV
jgi:hypothetical protein